MGIFSKQNQPDESRKRNSFDGSHQTNVTTRFGVLTPVLCKEIVAGDSWRINTAFGLRFMPTAFPIQTKMKAKIDYFYVRYRNLWSGWKNFFTKVGKQEAFPVLSAKQALANSKTGSLGDYLGLPTTLVGANNVVSFANAYAPLYDLNQAPSGHHSNFRLSVSRFRNEVSDSVILSNSPQGSENEGFNFYSWLYFSPTSDVGFTFSSSSLSSSAVYSYDGVPYARLNLSSALPSWLVAGLSSGEYCLVVSNLSAEYYNSSTRTYNSFYLGKGSSSTSDGSFPLVHYDPSTPGYIYVYHTFLFSSVFTDKRFIISVVHLPLANDNALTDFSEPLSSLPSISVLQSDTSYEVVEATDRIAEIPYEISAMPFRAYEQIYNAFYRDDRNNPYLVDGIADPNVFLPTLVGGVDDNEYKLHYANWEQDFLTTALPSPQYGVAPLVGISTSGTATFLADDGTEVTSKLETGSDGDTIVGFSTTKNTAVNRSLVELASSGISINDLRGVNSLQRYLEAKYRACLRYRDQMNMHFGVNLKYDEVDYPEFLGSVTTMVNVEQINQTSKSEVGDPLGSYAGQLSAMGASNGYIQHYFDEPGLIIGIMSVIPVPVYSQLLPKHFTKTNDAFDYYYSEFAHLGYQPVPYREVCPLQASNSAVPLDKTFGYQRAWYDYLSFVDEIHGDFRKSLNDFVLARVFNTVPSLNEEFLTVRPESLNDIFTVNEVEVDGKMMPIDTILGQVHFDITMQRPIPRLGIPRLE